jgi:hypothetical protein
MSVGVRDAGCGERKQRREGALARAGGQHDRAVGAEHVRRRVLRAWEPEDAVREREREADACAGVSGRSTQIARKATHRGAGRLGSTTGSRTPSAS